jgi:L-alanine-DL-glutamate epimerase-like enolase superfamily enzyme
MSEQIKVTKITATPFSIPLREHVKVAIAEFSSRDHVLVQVHTDAGVTGVAEAVPRWMSYGETQASVVEALSSLIGPALIGADVFDRSGLTRRLRNLVANNSARAAVDIAMWDIAGKILGQPVWRLLGGSGDPVPVAALIHFGEVAAAVRHAEHWRGDYGVTAFKVKVGREPGIDAAVCIAIRKAVGDDAVLYADANQGFSADEALRFLSAADAAQLAWLEDPVASGDQLGRRKIANMSPVAIAGDGICKDLDGVRRAVLDDGCRVISVKMARTGFTESQKIAAFCEATHTRPTIGSQGDTGLGATAGLNFAASLATSKPLPCEIVPHLGLVADILVDSQRLAYGRMAPPTVPGVGAEVDEEALRKYSIALVT